MSSELGVERPTTLPLPAEPQEERRVHFGDVSRRCLISDDRRQTTTPFAKDAECRPKRLRSASFSAGEFRYGNKRRKRYRVLPSKFLLGGNITDPLNLGSLEEREEANQLSLVEAGVGAISKKSDAVRVIIPPNINDPLNLDVSSDNEDSLNEALLKQIRRRRRSRKRKRRLSEPSGDTLDCESLHVEPFDECQIEKKKEAQPKKKEAQPKKKEAQPSTTITEVFPKISLDTLKPLTVNTELPTPTAGADDQRESAGPITPVGTKPSTSGFQRPVFKKQRNKSDNKIVSPVIPQPGVERKRHPSHSRQYMEKPHLSQQNLKLPKNFNPKNELFQYGNYNKYYGYRNPDMSQDVRLDYLKPEWFEGKEVLDVGCNIGHLTLTIARDFQPRKVVGIDIDKKLVNIAQKNIKHYLKKGDIQETNFPKSMRLLYGPLKPPVTADGVRCFPHNIKFVHANYVLESDELLETVRPEFDVIMCFSITKWIHLNWGDGGLKRFFRRIFYNLNPGGRLILEPQGWPSYNKRRKLTMRIFENYKNIRLFPDKFNDYLLHEVGFSTSEKMITPQHTSRGFQRPIIVYTKAGSTTKSSSLDDKCPRKISTKQVVTLQRCHSSPIGCGLDGVGNNKMEVAQEVREKQGADRAVNVTNLVPSKLENSNSSSAQGRVLEEGSPRTERDKEKAGTMDCVLESQCDDKTERLGNGQGLASKRESESYVCDNIDTSKSTGGEGDNCLTHSLNHKPNQCVSESQLPSQSNTSNGSELCTKVGASEPHAKPTTKPNNEVTENVPKDKAGSSGTPKRTSLGTADSDHSNGSCAAVTNVHAMQDTECEISKEVVDKVDKVNPEGLLSVTKPRSPNICETKDRP